MSRNTVEKIGMSGLYTKNRKSIEDALALNGKRSALAMSIGVSDGQLSKLLNGEIHRFCQILEQLDLVVMRHDYIDAIERVLQEKLTKG